MKHKEPNMVGEIFLSLVKWFLVILIINNLIWACVHYGYFAKSFDGTAVSAELNQNNNIDSNVNATQRLGNE